MSHTDKLTSQPPDLKSHTKNVSFVEIKPVNLWLYTSAQHVSQSNKANVLNSNTYIVHIRFQMIKLDSYPLG